MQGWADALCLPNGRRMQRSSGLQPLAGESKLREEERSGATIYTEILPLTTFYPAEDYHQKYELRGNAALLSALAAIFSLY